MIKNDFGVINIKRNFLQTAFKLKLPKLEIIGSEVELTFSILPNGNHGLNQIELSDQVELEKIIIRDENNNIVLSGNYDASFNLKNGEATRYILFKNTGLSNDLRDYSIEFYFYDFHYHNYIDVFYEIEEIKKVTLIGVNVYSYDSTSRFSSIERRYGEELKAKEEKIRELAKLHAEYIDLKQKYGVSVERNKELEERYHALITRNVAIKENYERAQEKNKQLQDMVIELNKIILDSKSSFKAKADYTKTNGYKEAIRASEMPLYGEEKPLQAKGRYTGQKI